MIMKGWLRIFKLQYIFTKPKFLRSQFFEMDHSVHDIMNFNILNAHFIQLIKNIDFDVIIELLRFSHSVLGNLFDL